MGFGVFECCKGPGRSQVEVQEDDILGSEAKGVLLVGAVLFVVVTISGQPLIRESAGPTALSRRLQVCGASSLFFLAMSVWWFSSYSLSASFQQLWNGTLLWLQQLAGGLLGTNANMLMEEWGGKLNLCFWTSPFIDCGPLGQLCQPNQIESALMWTYVLRSLIRDLQSLRLGCMECCQPGHDLGHKWSS